ncbi:MAG: hypothetical protein NTX53_11405 [candidate division WOR-3 bacterium]|nr:hypothetical protein [candidate division WOR-3 bacterium]
MTKTEMQTRMLSIAKTHEVEFHGKFLQRGFWLYVWEVAPSKGKKRYYVGRTGDNPPCNAQSPFNRMGQHLGFQENSNMLRRHLRDKHRIDPETCEFRLVAHGPILKEATTKELHNQRRNVIAAMEKALADSMQAAGYDVMNVVKSRKALDARLFAQVRRAFAAEFPKLRVMRARRR